MSINPATAKLLHDARSAGEELLKYCDGRSRADLYSDRTLQLVVQRLIEIIGEALRQAEHTDPAIEERIDRIRDIVGTRNRLIPNPDEALRYGRGLSPPSVCRPVGGHEGRPYHGIH